MKWMSASSTDSPPRCLPHREAPDPRGFSYGRTWDRTRPKRNRPRPTLGDSTSGLQGDSGPSGNESGRPETTTSDSAFGQEPDSDDADLDDDPRSQRGPSRTTATPPEVTGDEPAD